MILANHILLYLTKMRLKHIIMMYKARAFVTIIVDLR